MRFITVASDKFERPSTPGVFNLMKEIIEIPPQDNFSSRVRYSIPGNQQLDRLAASVYGSGNEYQWYLIADRNARQIVGWRGDFSYVNKIDIPSPEEYR